MYEYVQAHKHELGVQLYANNVAEFLFDAGLSLPMMREEIGRMFAQELPEIFRRAKRARKVSMIRLDYCERGLVSLLSFDRERIVVKTTNSKQESEIAHKLGLSNIGPEIFERTQDVLAEQFIDAPNVGRFIKDPIFVGDCYGRILNGVHQAGVVYDNRMHDHIRIKKGWIGDPRLSIIDLETAHFGQDFDTDWKIAQKELNQMYSRENNREQAFAGLARWQ